MRMYAVATRIDDEESRYLQIIKAENREKAIEIYKQNRPRDTEVITYRVN